MNAIRGALRLLLAIAGGLVLATLLENVALALGLGAIGFLELIMVAIVLPLSAIVIYRLLARVPLFKPPAVAPTREP